MKGHLIFSDGTTIEGTSFGAETSIAGEIAFSTSMMGYPESLTDPSYKGQILTLSYPIVGSYGVPKRETWESGKIQVSGLIVSQYIDTPSHFQSSMSLSQWLKSEHIPALEISDTRFIVKKIRDEGATLVKIEFGEKIDFIDPNKENLVAQVSTQKIETIGKGKKKVVLIDCGVKDNIVRELVKRNVTIIRVPWDCDFIEEGIQCDGVLVSNGPGDPKMADKTIEIVKKILALKIPLFGICLGNQILALASGGDTYKLAFGHRGQNQPCSLVGSKTCYITTQNHGFAIGKIPPGFKPWFINCNDGTNEGIIHKTLPFMSVQFHPEAAPGPVDTSWLFDQFISML
ncbi:MAG: glutamine-hydrolyzing carbamoyl-phosphate synthase small subunit [Candidatus Roizmanbacteria bacterium]|nr:glutamine-hydrolyzing carbamoyl-phosphate synthase small subunit [Candidatus Roizmanbacteria bacterium]